MSGHLSFRQLTNNEIRTVEHMSNSGRRCSRILLIVRELRSLVNDFLLSSKNLQIHRKCDLIIISIFFSYKHQHTGPTLLNQEKE
jgi:hypothetical protein